MITLYKYLGILLIPLIKFNLKLRLLNGKEDKYRIKERYGKTSLIRPKKDLIWIHATSIGEFKSADLLINKYYKSFTILVTTTTMSAANFATENYKNKIIHQFAPLDIYYWIENFLDQWKPKLVLWIESDLWPITTKLLKQKRIKSMLINVRMSPQSFEKWKNMRSFYKTMTDCFSEIFAQSKLDKERIEYLTKRKIKFIGNLKFSSKFKIDSIKINNFIKDIQNKKILIMASTHNDEEVKFLPIINNLLKKLDNLIVIIAPRHPERSEAILNIYLKNKISIKYLENKALNEERVFLINTFGILPALFKVSDIVFLGGSFVKKGGHNPVEPGINNCFIITGPSVYNWQNIYDDMKKNKACIIFKEMSKIESYLIKFFNDKKNMKILKDRSKKISKKNIFNSKLLIYSINNLIKL